MKYNNSNEPLVCMLTNSTCYKNTTEMEIKGVLIHSTGVNNPYLKRYVQPSENDPNYKELMALLGKNYYGNDWNHIQRWAGLNAWIGKLADGTATSVQTMPWDYRPWGCGVGKRGTCNNGWIQYEICEDSLKDPEYFNQIYKETCELTAFLCKKFNIDPFGYTTLNGILVPTILYHGDASNLQLGDGHVDVNHWFPKFGKSIDTVRQDVYALLKQEEEEEDEDMTQEKFNEMMNQYLLTLTTEAPSDWSAADRDWAIANGLVQGDGNGNYMWKKFLTREEMVAILHRFEVK